MGVEKDEVLSRLTAQEIYGEDLIRVGDRLRMKCPFHEDSDPSFYVTPGTLTFKCFGCGKGGSAFDFVMQKEGLDFGGALKLLAKKANIDVKTGKGKFAPMHAANAEALRAYIESLNGNPSVMTYLTETRGLSEEMIKKFRLGYANGDSVLPRLKEKGLSEDVAIEAGLAKKRNGGQVRDFFWNRVMFPVISGGNVKGFGGRIIEGDGPKYINTPSSPVFSKKSLLYGLEPFAIKNAGFAIVVEGYLDVIQAHQHGFTNTVAPLGTALTSEHISLLLNHCDRVVVIFDGDKAGQNAAQSSVRRLFDRRVKGHVVVLPDGHDPDSFLRAGGDLNEIIGDADPFSVYLAKMFPQMRQVVFNALITRSKDEIIDFLAHMGSEEEKEAFLELSSKYALNRLLKSAPEVASKEDLKVKKMGDALFLMNKNGFTFWNAIKGDDLKAQAEEMMDYLIKVRVGRRRTERRAKS